MGEKKKSRRQDEITLLLFVKGEERGIEFSKTLTASDCKKVQNNNCQSDVK